MRGAVLHQGALGDFLLALPVIEGISRAIPRLEFDFWSRPQHLRLLHSKPYVASTHDCWGRDWMFLFQEDRPPEDPPLPPGLEQAQCLFLFGRALSSTVPERLKSRINAAVYWLQSFPDEGYGRHATDFIADQARALGLPLVMGPLTLAADPGEVAAVRERLRLPEASAGQSILAVHPGSGGIRKVWPLSRWGVLLHRLREERNVWPFLILGPADEKIAPLIHALAASLGIPVVQDLELPGLAALLSLCDLYVGNDSGATHLAAAMGTPVVGVFGPTDPEVWAPRGDHVRVFRDQWEAGEVLDLRATAAGSRSAATLAAVVGAELAERRSRR